MVIFLVGFMGSGKNWWGSILAEQNDIPFYDLDEEIVQSLGMDIVSVFQEKGEGFFREKESQALTELTGKITRQRKGNESQNKQWEAIIATGGGTPCFNDNMKLMNQLGLTVWLNPSVEELAARLEKETDKRPLLQGMKGKELVDFVAGKLAERRPFYEMAQIEIKNTHIAVQELIKTLRNAPDIY
jgi:shikimate kinase